MEIALEVQRVVGVLPRKENESSPSQIIEKQTINCVGATMIGGALLQEAGISYLVAMLPKHTLTVLLPSDGKVFWHDQLFAENNKELFSDDDTIRNLVHSFAHDATSKVLELPPQGEKTAKQGNYFHVFRPEDGHKFNMINNTTGLLEIEKESLAACFGGEIQLEWHETSLLYGTLGNNYLNAGYWEDSVAAFHKGYTIAPENDDFHELFASVIQAFDGHPQEFERYKQIIAEHPKSKEFAGIYKEAGRHLMRKAYSTASEMHSARCKGKLEAADAKEKEVTALRKSAVIAYRESLGLNNDDVIAHKKLAKLLIDTGNREEGIAEYEKVIMLDETDTESHIDLAKILTTEDPTSAATLYEKAIAMDPQRAFLYCEYGLFLQDTAGKLDESLAVFRKAEEVAAAGDTDLIPLIKSFIKNIQKERK